jgi:tripartite-type tricarboxylate transporter receptor subunit TctC
MSTAKPLIEGGKAKGIAVTSKGRSSGLPDLPTIAEQGYPGFEVTTWFGFLAPAGTPRPIIDRIQTDLVKTLNEPDVKERLGGNLALTLVGSGPDEFGRFIDGQMEQWGKVVRENNITAE